MFGAFAYVGADLRHRFGLSYSVIGLVIGTFGVGGLIYAGMVKQFVARFGQAGLAAGGGIADRRVHICCSLPRPRRGSRPSR